MLVGGLGIALQLADLRRRRCCFINDRIEDSRGCFAQVAHRLERAVRIDAVRVPSQLRHSRVIEQPAVLHEGKQRLVIRQQLERSAGMEAVIQRVHEIQHRMAPAEGKQRRVRSGVHGR